MDISKIKTKIEIKFLESGSKLKKLKIPLIIIFVAITAICFSLGLPGIDQDNSQGCGADIETQVEGETELDKDSSPLELKGLKVSSTLITNVTINGKFSVPPDMGSYNLIIKAEKGKEKKFVDAELQGQSKMSWDFILKEGSWNIWVEISDSIKKDVINRDAAYIADNIIEKEDKNPPYISKKQTFRISGDEFKITLSINIDPKSKGIFKVTFQEEPQKKSPEKSKKPKYTVKIIDSFLKTGFESYLREDNIIQAVVRTGLVSVRDESGKELCPNVSLKQEVIYVSKTTKDETTIKFKSDSNSCSFRLEIPLMGQAVIKIEEGDQLKIGLCAGNSYGIIEFDVMLSDAISPNPGIDGDSVSDHGAMGDGVTDDTEAIQALLNSGARVIYFPEGRYSVNTLNVPSSVHHIYGSGVLLQRSLSQHILSVTNSSELIIEGLHFLGLGGSVSESLNSGIYVLSSSNVNIRNNTFSGCREHGIYIQGSSYVNVTHNEVYNTAGGIRFTGVTNSTITRNTARDTSLPNGTFTVGIGLDSTDGHQHGVCRDIQITNNIVRNYVNSQAILLHAGVNVNIQDNIVTNVLIGVSINPYNSSDTTQNITVSNNSYVGTDTNGASPEFGNYGIFVGGGDGNSAATPTHVIVDGNNISDSNAVLLQYYFGGIGIGYTDDVEVKNNGIQRSRGAGISLTNPNTRLNIHDNLITNVIATPDTTRAGIYLCSFAGNQSGTIERNRIDGVLWGMRFDAFSPELRVGNNNITNFTNLYINPQNVTLSDDN